MKFLYYDILFLIISVIAVAIFLYRHKKKLQIESKILLLYRTQWGIKLIDRISKKFPRTIKVFSYISIFFGYILMAGGIYLIWISLILIINAVALPKIPPLFPLIPYLPDLFKISFLPPFYFTYWIITIGIVAIVHEFAHGIFARADKIRLKSTGFGFLGPFLAAFVEIDEKQMAKKSVKTQLSILAGGSFSNLILAVLFMLILNLFFVSFYSPAGMGFNTYTLGIVNISTISAINNIGISNADYQKISLAYSQLNLTNKTQDLKIISDEKKYFIDANSFELQMKSKQGMIVAYEDTPAYTNKIAGAITELTFKETTFKIKNQADLSSALSTIHPGDEIFLKTTNANYSLTLAADPTNSSKPYLGVGIMISKSKLAWLADFLFLNKKDPSVYYAPTAKGDFWAGLTIFISNLLFWIVIINVSVMLVNMLPFGIFDGGRFFYLTILGLTKSTKKAEKWFKVANFIIFMILMLMMVVWFYKIL